jgi:succinate-acetate transporter protein
MSDATMTPNSMGTTDSLQPKEMWTEAGPVRGPLPQRDVQALAERTMATVASPLPLGLSGFAAATFTISAVYAGWFPAAAVVFAIPVAFFYGGIAQFLAGMWSYRKGDTLAATAFGTFGSFNMAWAILELLIVTHILRLGGVAGVAASAGIPGAAGVAGTFIAMFSFVSFFLMAAAFFQNLGIAWVLFTLGCTYGFLAAGLISGPTLNWMDVAGGWSGVVSSVSAFLVAASIVFNSVVGREWIPTLRMK